MWLLTMWQSHSKIYRIFKLPKREPDTRKSTWKLKCSRSMIYVHLRNFSVSCSLRPLKLSFALCNNPCSLYWTTILVSYYHFCSACWMNEASATVNLLITYPYIMSVTIFCVLKPYVLNACITFFGAMVTRIFLLKLCSCHFVSVILA